MFNQTTVTQQSVKKGRKEKHMQDTIFYMSCHQKILPINFREHSVLLTQKKRSELAYRAFSIRRGSKRKTRGFIFLFVLIPSGMPCQLFGTVWLAFGGHGYSRWLQKGRLT